MDQSTRQPERTAVKGGRPRNPRTQQRILNAAADLVLEHGFKALSIDAIAGRAGVGRMTIYRRWPNKAAIVMDAFFARVDPSIPFQSDDKTYIESIRLNMRALAKVYRGKDGALIRTLLAEAQFDPELATAIQERWVMPRRRISVPYFEKGIRDGFLRPDLDPNVIIDLLYAPFYFQLLLGKATLPDAYIDKLFDHAMRGLKRT
jgi:AcrR family transcriptional regulator